MKSACALFSLMLVSVAIPLAAQTINVNLNRGNVTLYGPGGQFGVQTTSFLTAPGYTITNVSGDDPANTGIGTLCNENSGGCSPSQIASNIGTGFGIIGFPPNGSMIVNGQPFGMWNFPGFYATTFTSTLGADSILTVYGSAAGYGSFNECATSGSCLGIPNEVHFLFGNTKWQYVGQFVPDPSTQGAYDFRGMVISSGPVPLINKPLVPDSLPPGSAGFSLRVNGTGFVSGSVVLWNGSPRTTTFVSDSELTAEIHPSDMASATTAWVNVVNPSLSDISFFQITVPTRSVALAKTDYPTGSGPFSVAVGNFNGDGILDLVVANQNDSTLSILLGKGDGTFQAPTSFLLPANAQPYAVAVGDFNRDGKPDLVTTNSGYDNVGIALGNGDGTFKPEIVSAGLNQGSDSALAMGDFNGDGNLDLAVTYAGGVDILLGNGDGTLRVSNSYVTNPGYGVNSVAVGDFNRDGKLDLIVGNFDPINTVTILLGNGDGTFKMGSSFSSGQGTIGLTAGDFNGDGKIDVAVADFYANAVSVLLGNGDATFQAASVYPGTGFADSISSGDFSGDGNLDLAVAGEDGAWILLGNGDGTFQSPVPNATGSQPESISVGDFNRDGRLDLAIANYVSNTVSVSLQLPVHLSSTNLRFGNQLVGTTSAQQQVRLTFIGAPKLKIASISTTGDFAQTSTCPIGGTLQTGESCTISVTFTPTATGSRTGTLSITDDANTSPQVVALSGVGTQPVVTLSPASLNFGNQTVGITGHPHSVTLTNIGNAALTITSIAVSLSNGSFAKTNNCGTSLAAGASCKITLSWKPSTPGNMNGNITFTDNAPDSPEAVSLAGVGVLPAVTLSPTRLSFPTQVVFTTSKAKTVTLTNNGAGILKIRGIAATGPFAQTNTCGTTVNSGASCTISIAFKPTTIGSLAGSVSVTDNAPGSPQNVPLKGTGTYVQLIPSQVNFGNQPVGTTSLPKKITLSNKGSVALNITSISITGADGQDFLPMSTTCGNSVAAGASCFITLSFTPSATGKRTAEVSVSDNGGGSPQKVGLTGIGTP